MATITLRVPDADRDDLEEIARGQGTTISDLIRPKIDELLGRGTLNSRSAQTAPQSLSYVERRSLSLQHRILARVIALTTPGYLDERGYRDDEGYEGEPGDQIELATNLEAGYVPEYDQEFANFETEFTSAEGSFVMDVLDMFTVLDTSLTPEVRAELGDRVTWGLQFRGFDANDHAESRMLYYARHLIETGRWENMAHLFDNQHERGNSHMPVLDSYQRKLRVFAPIWKDIVRDRIHGGGPGPSLLTIEELRQVAAA